MTEAMMQDLLHQRMSMTPHDTCHCDPGMLQLVLDRQLHHNARGGQHHQTRLPCRHALTYLYKRFIDPVVPCLVLYSYQFS